LPGWKAEKLSIEGRLVLLKFSSNDKTTIFMLVFYCQSGLSKELMQLEEDSFDMGIKKVNEKKTPCA
jgi:hypothetical protein